MAESLSELADAVSEVEQRVADAIFATVRAQLRDAESDDSRELERRLAKVRRHLQKAEGLLRGYASD